MAGFLSMLPGLFGSMLKTGGSDKTLGLLNDVMAKGESSGLFSSIGKGIGNVLADIGGGKVNSWGEFGKSVARSAAPVFGYEAGTTPMADSKVSSAIEINKQLLENSPSAAIHRTMIVPEHPKPAIAPFMSQYKAPEIPITPVDANGQHIKPTIYLNGDSGEYEKVYRKGKTDEDIHGNFIDPAIMKKVKQKRKVIGKRKHKSIYSNKK